MPGRTPSQNPPSRREPRRALPYKVTWFRLGNDGQLAYAEVKSFKAALQIIPDGPRGWERYRIMRGDLFIERGDPFGPRGAPSPMRRGQRPPPNEWWERPTEIGGVEIVYTDELARKYG